MECCGEVGQANYHCGLCHQTFGALESFDEHQIRRYGQKPVIVCKTPQQLGLVPDGRAVWRTPEGLVRAQRDAARLAALRRPELAAREG